jgi:hypothetical protein
MTLDEFYAFFPRWEEQMQRCQQAQKGLEKALLGTPEEPQELLCFLGRREILSLLIALLRLLRLLDLVCPDRPAGKHPRYARIAALLREYGHTEVTDQKVADFFRAWRQEHHERILGPAPARDPEKPGRPRGQKGAEP